MSHHGGKDGCKCIITVETFNQGTNETQNKNEDLEGLETEG